MSHSNFQWLVFFSLPNRLKNVPPQTKLSVSLLVRCQSFHCHVPTQPTRFEFQNFGSIMWCRFNKAHILITCFFSLNDTTKIYVILMLPTPYTYNTHDLILSLAHWFFRKNNNNYYDYDCNLQVTFYFIFFNSRVFGNWRSSRSSYGPLRWSRIFCLKSVII